MPLVRSTAWLYDSYYVERDASMMPSYVANPIPARADWALTTLVKQVPAIPPETVAEVRSPRASKGRIRRSSRSGTKRER